MFTVFWERKFINVFRRGKTRNESTLAHNIWAYNWPIILFIYALFITLNTPPPSPSPRQKYNQRTSYVYNNNLNNYTFVHLVLLIYAKTLYYYLPTQLAQGGFKYSIQEIVHATITTINPLLIYKCININWKCEILR